VLDALEALDGVDLVEDDEGERLADPRHGSQQAERLRVVVLGRSQDVALQCLEDAVEVIDEFDVDVDGSLHLVLRPRDG